MKKTEEILNQWGLSLFLEEEEQEEMTRLFATNLFLAEENSKQEVQDPENHQKTEAKSLVFEMVSEREIMIREEELFKEKFGLPESCHELPYDVFETISLIASEEQGIQLYDMRSDEELRWLLLDYVGDHEEDFLESNKTYKMKKRFNPEGAQHWLIETLAVTAEDICKPEQSKTEREHLLEELGDAVIEDQKEYIQQKQKETTQ